MSRIRIRQRAVVFFLVIPTEAGQNCARLGWRWRCGIRVPLLWPRSMPGIDFTEVRARIHLADVLELAGFSVVGRMGHQVQGPCPVHGSSSPRSRSFSANLRRNTFRCFRCGAAGNQLDLWVAVSKLPWHEAAADLCARLGIEIPFIRRNGT